MNGNRISLITLGVKDLERSKAYYAAVGFVPEEETPSVVFYDMNGLKFGLFPLIALAKEQGRDASALGTGAGTISQNYNDPAGVDTAFARAIEAGATAVTPPTETAWGGYSGYVADPDGHIWEFAHNPFWPLNAEGWIA